MLDVLWVWTNVQCHVSTTMVSYGGVSLPNPLAPPVGPSLTLPLAIPHLCQYQKIKLHPI
jgi:hypothetical protein